MLIIEGPGTRHIEGCDPTRELPWLEMLHPRASPPATLLQSQSRRTNPVDYLGSRSASPFSRPSEALPFSSSCFLSSSAAALLALPPYPMERPALLQTAPAKSPLLTSQAILTSTASLPRSIPHVSQNGSEGRSGVNVDIEIADWFRLHHSQYQWPGNLGRCVYQSPGFGWTDDPGGEGKWLARSCPCHLSGCCLMA